MFLKGTSSNIPRKELISPFSFLFAQFDSNPVFRVIYLSKSSFLDVDICIFSYQNLQEEGQCYKLSFGNVLRVFPFCWITITINNSNTPLSSIHEVDPLRILGPTLDSSNLIR